MSSRKQQKQQQIFSSRQFVDANVNVSNAKLCRLACAVVVSSNVLQLFLVAFNPIASRV